MISLKYCNLTKSLQEINKENNTIINTINAYSYNIAKKNKLFSNALQESDYLLPDGQSIVWAKKILTGEKMIRIAGADLFHWEMNRMNEKKGTCFFLGSTEETLEKIVSRAAIEYPFVKIGTYSPPYKQIFSDEDNEIMISKINSFNPAVLFVGMTAPKQETWVAQHANRLNVGHICSIGAVFDFFAGNIKRAPLRWQKLGLEWLYRLIKEPKRMWRRYIIGNTVFIFHTLKEKIRT